MSLQEKPMIQKGKKGLLHVLFGRTSVIMIPILVQVGLLGWVIDYFNRVVPYFFGGHLLIGLVVSLWIINQPNNPTIKLSWVILLMFSPVIGGLLYLYVKTHPGQRILEKRLEHMYQQTKQYVSQNAEVREALEVHSKATARLSDYVRKFGNYQIYQNTDVTYFPLGEDKFAAMLTELEKAEKFIFLEYFIIEKSYMWDEILKILERKVSEGVEVRLMYDGTCAFHYLPYRYPEEMEEKGIQCKMFSPLRPFLSTHYNNRDHRKILVIDGKVGFTGGVNIGDEYINRRAPFGHWKDTALMLKGDAVEGLTQMFLQMWNVTERREEQYQKYLLPKQNDNTQNTQNTQGGFVMPFADSPFDQEQVGETVYMDIINRAVDYVHIMTPYLILDNEMVTALTYAAKRGVDVKLILPHIPDKKMPFALARSHYPQLLKAGVKIYEYTPGFVHAKVFCSDANTAVVGTINLDYRSLYLHFECGAFLFDLPMIQEIEADFQTTLEKCEQITIKTYHMMPIFQKIMGKALRILAPLM